MALGMKKANKTKNQNQKKDKNQLPKTIADSIPYVAVYENGVFEVRPGVFSKSYLIPAVNFKTATDNDQWRLAEMYSEFLNSFDDDVDVQITLYNKTVDMEEFQKRVFIPMKADHLNDYRVEYNQMLENTMRGAKNNLETEKILTVTIEAPDIAMADDKFAQIDAMVAENMSQMTKHASMPMSAVERLDILNQIYNGGDARPLYETRRINGRLSESFTLANCASQGITTKDLIAPESMEFKSNQARIGDLIVKSFYVVNYPTYIKGTILTDFSAIPSNMLTSVYITPYNMGAAIQMVKKQNTNIRSEAVEAEKKAAQQRIYGDLAVSPTLKEAQNEAEGLLTKITRDNIKLYTVTFLFTLFAKSEEEMKGYEEQLKLIANKNLLTIRALGFQQEQGLNSALPLGNNQLYVHHLMTTQSVASIIPFDVKEIRQDGGMYYGRNAVSGNMILYNRTSDVNPNSCILGMPGAGKSFAAKREIINVLLNTEDEVYIIDPEREYRALAEEMGGSVIKIATGSSVHINPFDLNIENADDAGDPVKIKSDFIETICEIMVGGKYGLSPIEKSIIGRSVINVYEPYMQMLKRRRITQDFQRAPTLKDFYEDLCQQPQREAQNLALSLERYVRGSLDVFSYRTNINTSGRFVVYDIKDIGAGLKELGLQIALDNIWNKMIENYNHGKRTWFYIDEFYLMMQKPSSAQYISQIWKRARKWKGCPCAITQNVEDMLKSEDARTIINNCSFVMMLGQSPINKQQLSNMMNISPVEQKYISTAKPGMGLIRIGDNLIPMDDSFPKGTKLYELMTTNPEERDKKYRKDMEGGATT